MSGLFERKYAPKKDETAEEYAAHLDSIQNPNLLVLKASRLIATAMEQGAYETTETERDGLSKALHHIVVALEAYDTTQGMASVPDKLMEFAAQVAGEQRGRHIDVDKARSLLGGKARDDIKPSLSKALSATWVEVKAIAQLTGDNVDSNKVIKAFKESRDGRFFDTPASKLIKQINDFRQTCKDGQKK